MNELVTGEAVVLTCARPSWSAGRWRSPFAYPVAVETLTRGRSIGKIALGLRVVRTDGGPIRFRHALARGLAGLAYLAAVAAERRRRQATGG